MLEIWGDRIFTREISAYAQVDWTMWKFRSVVGARFVDNELAGSHVSPRVSLIYNMDSSCSIKLLYSEGFNSPVISQQDLIIPFVIEGNHKLKAEIVRTVDLAYTYATQNQIFVVNGYYLKTDQIIDRVKEEKAKQPQYQNGEGFDRYGAEVDFQKSFKNIKLLTNITYNHQGNKDIEEDARAKFIPKVSLSLGARYRINNHHSIGLSERFWSKRGRESEKVDDQNITNVTYQYKHDYFKYFINIENIFDHDIENPDVNTDRVHSVPGGPGKTFYTGIVYSF